MNSEEREVLFTIQYADLIHILLLEGKILELIIQVKKTTTFLELDIVHILMWHDRPPLGTDISKWDPNESIRYWLTEDSMRNDYFDNDDIKILDRNAWNQKFFEYFVDVLQWEQPNLEIKNGILQTPINMEIPLFECLYSTLKNYQYSPSNIEIEETCINPRNKYRIPWFESKMFFLVHHENGEMTEYGDPRMRFFEALYNKSFGMNGFHFINKTILMTAITQYYRIDYLPQYQLMQWDLLSCMKYTDLLHQFFRNKYEGTQPYTFRLKNSQLSITMNNMNMNYIDRNHDLADTIRALIEDDIATLGKVWQMHNALSYSEIHEVHIHDPDLGNSCINLKSN